MNITDDHQVPRDPPPGDDPTPDQQPSPSDDPIPDHNPVSAKKAAVRDLEAGSAPRT